jgi:hypothetical protein
MPERRIDGKDLLAWTATLVAFPFAGFAARAVVGPVDGTWTALLAGAVSGAVIGLAQWLALRRIGADPRWIVATALAWAPAWRSATRWSATATTWAGWRSWEP